MPLRTWIKRIAIVWGIQLLVFAAYIAWMSTGSYVDWGDCYYDPEPTEVQIEQAAYKELVFQAMHAALNPDQFFLKARPYPMEFHFQMKGDVERPRRIEVKVDHCLHTESEFHNMHPQY
jgi:hypothetical protein